MESAPVPSSSSSAGPPGANPRFLGQCLGSFDDSHVPRGGIALSFPQTICAAMHNVTPIGVVITLLTTIPRLKRTTVACVALWDLGGCIGRALHRLTHGLNGIIRPQFLNCSRVLPGYLPRLHVMEDYSMKMPD